MALPPPSESLCRTITPNMIHPSPLFTRTRSITELPNMLARPLALPQSVPDRTRCRLLHVRLPWT
jgi:hypothetical protein